MTKTKKSIYRIAECAVFIALAAALTYVEIQVGGLGGSINFVMIPLFIMCYRNGAKYSLVACTVFGFIKCILGGSLGYGLPSILLDYVLAYGVCGVAGFFKGKPKFIELAALLGCIARFGIHFISGITLYAITGPTAVEGTNLVLSAPVLFSLVYNGLYMIPDTIIAVVGMAILHYPLMKLDKTLPS